jgi:hypothetical protein
MVLSGILIFKLSVTSLVVIRPVGETIWDGWPTTQLPFLALRILCSFGSLEGGTHVGLLPECGTQHKSIEHRS